LCWCTKLLKFFIGLSWLSLSVPGDMYLLDVSIVITNYVVALQASTIALGWLPHAWGNATALIAKDLLK